jgi:hypothetical protein
MRKMGISPEAAAELLDFTAEELSALLIHIQSQNGNRLVHEKLSIEF